MKQPSDYHDYVFKDGKFIGNFEEMYKYADGIPWHLDEVAYRLFSDIDIAILSRFRYSSICQIGSALGYFTNRLHRELKFRRNGSRLRVTGIDISRTAVKKSQKKFPGISFVCANLIKERPLAGEYFDLVVIKEVLWYVTHELERFLRNSVDLIKDNGFLFVSQSFPPSDTWVGQDVIDSPKTLVSILKRFVEPVYYCLEADSNFKNKPTVHILGRKVAR